MADKRASIFEEPEVDLNEIDVSGFAPKSAKDNTAPRPEAVRAVSEAAQFRSREATIEPPSAPAPSAKREQRRHRTGRNVQLNLKVSQETLDAFYAASDRCGWVLGETLEHAIAALEEQLAKREGQGS